VCALALVQLMAARSACACALGVRALWVCARSGCACALGVLLHFETIQRIQNVSIATEQLGTQSRRWNNGTQVSQGPACAAATLRLWGSCSMCSKVLNNCLGGKKQQIKQTHVLVNLRNKGWFNISQGHSISEWWNFLESCCSDSFVKDFQVVLPENRS
jgi:hypothetical protein